MKKEIKPDMLCMIRGTGGSSNENALVRTMIKLPPGMFAATTWICEAMQTVRQGTISVTGEKKEGKFYPAGEMGCVSECYLHPFGGDQTLEDAERDWLPAPEVKELVRV